MSKILGLIVVVVVAVIVVMAGLFVLLKDDEPDDGDNTPDEDDTPGGKTLVFNGMNYTWSELEETFQNRTVDGKVGFSISDIMNTTSFSEISSDDQNKTLFRITADDGWQKNVSWMDLQSGIIIKTDYMTYFPGLTGGFKVKNVASIDDVPLGPIMILKVGGTMAENSELTWSDLSAALAEVNVVISGQNASAMTLEDVLEYAGFTGLENATITIEGVDGDSKTVNWTQAQNGYLVEDGMKSYFEGLAGAYRIKNVIRIWVEY